MAGLLLVGSRLVSDATTLDGEAAEHARIFVAHRSNFTERFKSSERIEIASFKDRFQPAIDEPLGKPPQAVLGGQVAWFDPSYSFGPSPAALARPPVSVAATKPNVQQVAVQPKPPTAKPVEVAALPSASAPAREVAVATAPANPAKPDVRGPRGRAAYSHDALVRKAKAVLLAQAKAGRPSWFDKLFNKEPEHTPVLAYASADTSDVTGSVGTASESSPLDRYTAVYDIIGKTVYMPDGSKLEAHSGLGPKMDKPAYAHVKMHGVTPPHVYDITPREALFHGVAALRLTPLGGAGAIHNRTGLLAHTYMLGPNGDSNGCVSFKDYDRFLQAYRNGQVKRLVVVASMD
ncbi:MAG: hypothetical protein A4S14_01140 [Proteobacteria bacterium SG_bin9]|nr:MAG: hypothetical protein A4S14_01140 [Proteobacteria bacterium SG_bin9]